MTIVTPAPISDFQFPVASPPVIHPLPPYRLPMLRPYQMAAGRAIVDSALNGRGLTFTVMMARQAGKNEISAQVELLLLVKSMRRQVDGVKCAPTFSPQGEISMRRLLSRFIEGGLAELADVEAGRAVRVGNCRMVFLSAEPGANVVGHTAGLILEVDEAQDVDREKFDREFRPMAATTGATTVYYGTPWDESTLLEQAVQQNLELQRRDGVQRHFQADWMDVAAQNPDYARHVEFERERLGATHPMFLTQYALKTVPGAGRLFNGAQRAQLQGNHSRQHAPAHGGMYVAGLDIGGQGDGDHDATVLTIARVVEPPAEALVPEPRLEIVEQLALTGTPHDELIARLADLAGRVWNVRRLMVDATGIGETMARLLQRQLGESVVRPVKFTAETKSKLGYALISAVNGGRLGMYSADGSAEYAETWRQVELARIAYRPSRLMNFYVDPAEGHDDYLVSMALAVHAVADGIEPPRIARGRASGSY